MIFPMKKNRAYFSCRCTSTEDKRERAEEPSRYSGSCYFLKGWFCMLHTYDTHASVGCLGVSGGRARTIFRF